jgi:hypothetical protein
MFLYNFSRRAWPELGDGFQPHCKTYSKQNSNMKISSGDLSPKKSGRTSTNQGVIQVHNPQKAYRKAHNGKIGQTAVECTANYSGNSLNNK